MKKATFFVILCWLFSAGVCTWAQVDTGALVGVVKDPTGANFANATVTAMNVETGVRVAVKSNADGNYVLTPLKIGTYSLSVEAEGFEKEVRNDLVLNVQQSIRLNFTLKVGSSTC